jgi:WD40 repeat protein
VTSAQQGDTLLWNTATGEIARRFPTGGPFAVSPDGHVAAIARNNPDFLDPSTSLVLLLDLRTGARRSALTPLAHTWIIAVQFTSDGKSIVGASFDGAVRVWDVASGAIVQTFTGQPSGVNLAVVPSGDTAVSGGANGSVAAWDLSGTQRLGKTIRWNSSRMGRCPTIPCVVVNPQGTLMASNQGDGTVVLVDLRTQRLVNTLPARNGARSDALAFFPDGQTLATGGAPATSRCGM